MSSEAVCKAGPTLSIRDPLPMDAICNHVGASLLLRLLSSWPADLARQEMTDYARQLTANDK